MTTPSGILSYTLPLLSSRYEEGDARPSLLGSRSPQTIIKNPSTGNLITGWKWDDRVWTDDTTENNAEVVPFNWDPTTSGIPTDYFQTGIGNGTDLNLDGVELVEASGLINGEIENQWCPLLNHGYYYEYENQKYLFSDDSVIVYPSLAGVVPAQARNLILLSSYPKLGVPIVARQLQWIESEDLYEDYLVLEKKTYFTGQKQLDGTRLSTWDGSNILYSNIDQTKDEFVLLGEDLIFTKQYVSHIAETAASGIQSHQIVHSSFAPIDSTAALVVSSTNPITHIVTSWTVVSEGETLSGNQVAVDYDLGLFTFGNSDGSGTVVPLGNSILLSYYKTLRVEYESTGTEDSILGIETNINPIYRTSNEGFVTLKDAEEYPYSIVLSSNLPVLPSGLSGPLYLGSPLARLIATVKDKNGNTLEGEFVTFGVTSSPFLGTFGGAALDETIEVPTDANGEAIAPYIPPQSINDLSEYIDYYGFAQSGVNTVLSTSSLSIQGNLADVRLYEIFLDDPIQGYLNTAIAEDAPTQLATFYNTYLSTSNITGGTANSAWEDYFRMAWNLARPLLFTGQEGQGRRQLVAVTSTNYLNPDGAFQPPAFGPIVPLEVWQKGPTNCNIKFPGNLPIPSGSLLPEPSGSPIPGPSGSLWGYMVEAPANITFQAAVYSSKLDKVLLSNELTLRIQAPPYMDGTTILATLSNSDIAEISSALVAHVTASGTGGTIPFGWRLPSSNVTVAGALNGVTFIDINSPLVGDPFTPVDIPGSGCWY